MNSSTSTSNYRIQSQSTSLGPYVLCHKLDLQGGDSTAVTKSAKSNSTTPAMNTPCSSMQQDKNRQKVAFNRNMPQPSHQNANENLEGKQNLNEHSNKYLNHIGKIQWSAEFFKQMQSPQVKDKQHIQYHTQSVPNMASPQNHLSSSKDQQSGVKHVHNKEQETPVPKLHSSHYVSSPNQHSHQMQIGEQIQQLNQQTSQLQTSVQNLQPQLPQQEISSHNLQAQSQIPPRNLQPQLRQQISQPEISFQNHPPQLQQVPQAHSNQKFPQAHSSQQFLNSQVPQFHDQAPVQQVSQPQLSQSKSYEQYQQPQSTQGLHVQYAQQNIPSQYQQIVQPQVIQPNPLPQLIHQIPQTQVVPQQISQLLHYTIPVNQISIPLNYQNVLEYGRPTQQCNINSFEPIRQVFPRNPQTLPAYQQTVFPRYPFQQTEFPLQQSGTLDKQFHHILSHHTCNRAQEQWAHSTSLQPQPSRAATIQHSINYGPEEMNPLDVFNLCTGAAKNIITKTTTIKESFITDTENYPQSNMLQFQLGKPKVIRIQADHNEEKCLTSEERNIADLSPTSSADTELLDSEEIVIHNLTKKGNEGRNQSSDLIVLGDDCQQIIVPGLSSKKTISLILRKPEREDPSTIITSMTPLNLKKSVMVEAGKQSIPPSSANTDDSLRLKILKTSPTESSNKASETEECYESTNSEEKRKKCNLENETLIPTPPIRKKRRSKKYK